MGFFENLKLKKFNGFTPKDFEEKDRITLHNGCLFTVEQRAEINRYPFSKKNELFYRIIKTFPNYKFISESAMQIKESLLEHGDDINFNRFLNFVLKVDFYLDFEVASLLYTLYKDDKISMNESWVFNKTLYTEDVDKILYKIKALAIANNKAVQVGFSKPLSLEDLIDKNNNILSYLEMFKVLNNITLNRN